MIEMKVEEKSMKDLYELVFKRKPKDTIEYIAKVMIWSGIILLIVYLIEPLI